MPAIITIGTSDFFFTSVTQASKCAELLGKATPVKDHGPYRLEKVRAIAEDDYHGLHRVEMRITQQKKPLSPQLALPGE